MPELAFLLDSVQIRKTVGEPYRWEKVKVNFSDELLLFGGIAERLFGLDGHGLRAFKAPEVWLESWRKQFERFHVDNSIEDHVKSRSEEVGEKDRVFAMWQPDDKVASSN